MSIGDVLSPKDLNQKSYFSIQSSTPFGLLTCWCDGG